MFSTDNIYSTLFLFVFSAVFCAFFIENKNKKYDVKNKQTQILKKPKIR